MEIDLVDLVAVEAAAVAAADSVVAEAAAVAAADSVADEVALVHAKCTKQPAQTAEKNAKFLSSPVMVLMEMRDLFTAKIATRIIKNSNFYVWLFYFLFYYLFPMFWFLLEVV